MRLSQALKEKRPLYEKRHDKVILLHENDRPHVAKPVKIYLEILRWEVLPHLPYSPDIAPSDFHLFRSIAHGLADQRFHSYEETKKWVDSWIASKDMSFFQRGIHILSERWEKVVSSDGKMSDEELVQCPYNPNHQVPRSQIDEHKKICKFLMDPNQEKQITISSYDEPRPSTSYQESPQEGSSLQEESSHQGGSQLATRPISGSPSTPERRSSDEPSDLQKPSPNRLQTSTPYSKPFQSSDTSDDTDIDLCGSEGSSDNQSKSQMTNIHSSTDDSSSSSDDSVLSPEDTMSDNNGRSLSSMGLTYCTNVSSTSQETDSSQQEDSSQKAAILQQPKLILGRKDKKMDDESSVDLSSRFSQELSDPLEFEMEEHSLPGNVQQKYSKPGCSYAGTTNDSVDLQRLIPVVESSPFGELSTSESISSSTETTDDSDDSQRLSKKSKMKPKEMVTEEKTEEETSYHSTDQSTSLEVYMKESSLSEKDSQEQSPPSCIPGQRTYYSEVSQQLGRKRKMEHEEIDTEEIMNVKVSHISTEVTTQSEVGVAGPSSSVPKEQSKPVGSPNGKTQESVGSQRQSRSRKNKYEELMEMDPVRSRHRSKPFKKEYARMYTEEKKEAKRSDVSTEETIPLEVQIEESSSSGDVSDIPVTHHGETIYDTSDNSSSNLQDAGRSLQSDSLSEADSSQKE
ncbi:PREDICTED: uncharacterized protein LOC107073667, partial [Polistes dominula]|uniref:Uncharacterized protein LOC107073667 n=1 Tax=Polistes dominula TaxID=743375 RepID=A0ABM1JBK3_POLDO